MMNNKQTSKNIFYVCQNIMYSSYEAVWQIPKLFLIAYEKMFIARN